jgi:hypothetical protein
MIRSPRASRQRGFSNPYLAHFFSLPTYCMRNPTIPLRDDLEAIMPEWLAFKTPIVTRFSWAVPTQQAIGAIARYTSRVIEIGAGSGYWAWLLSQVGVVVIAYDCTSPPDTWYPVRVGDESKVLLHRDATLFLCWPPAGSDMALNALLNYAGEYVIYVGEWLRGNASAEFFDVLTHVFEEVETICIPQWFMRTDQLSIHRRRR